MASAAFSPAIFHQEQPLHKPPPKDFQGFLPRPGKRQNAFSFNYASMQIGSPHSEYALEFSSLLSDSYPFGITPLVDKPELVDVQDTRPDSVLFSFGVAEQCSRHEKILNILTSSSNVTDGDDMDISLISDLMGFQPVVVDMCPQPECPMNDEVSLYGIGADETEKIIRPQKQLYVPQPLLDFVGNLSQTSSITVHPNGHVSFAGSAVEMKNLQSIVAEFDLHKSLSNGSRKEMVVPYFTRRRGGHARSYAQPSSSAVETLRAEPSKSAGKSKSQQRKKENKDPNSERYSKNYFYACDCLINAYLDRSGSKTIILALKDSGPELTKLLTQFSAGIVGTGLAVLISVACKAMNGKMALLASARLLNVSFGFGLFWLSIAVNRLRDTVNHFSKRSARAKMPNDDTVLVEKVRTGMNEILFRFIALMAIGLLSV